MFTLPMTALKIKGIHDDFIQLQIEEIWGFPDEISYGGGYGAKGMLTIHAENYSVTALHYFTTGELYQYYIQLQDCHQSLCGSAVLENTERALELKCEFDKLGHVTVSGNFQARPDIKNILFYEIQTDQTLISDALSDLKKIYLAFGDMNGIQTK